MKIVFVGAGNLATNVARALKDAGHEITQVYSRTQASADALASQVGAEAVSDLDGVAREADIYIVSVKDGRSAMWWHDCATAAAVDSSSIRQAASR